MEEGAPRGSQRSPRRNPVANKKLCERPGSAPTTAGASGPAASLRLQVLCPHPHPSLLRQPLCFPSPFPAPARSRAPAPAAPPVRSGPALHRPLALAPGGGAGGAAVPSPVRAGGVPIACHAPGLTTPLGLLAMDADDSRAPKGSLRKFLEHLSGAGKAIGVLTSGGDAQGPPRQPPWTGRTRKRELRDKLERSFLCLH
ncbi:PGC-1 and ERR-induced regulator in muscle protein 1-like [Trachypithecus francoisi]|uniref:PGC-1 and ERR-induced regulator in muscle protein 1-like n=1 Tax=Trachypithecus francoisi TaxID=54180 RepID=UPI00141B9D41|nr:PGC-1 and ERR-induced regulator in muscle protein 1-like [Trachypithecus francoisi]